MMVNPQQALTLFKANADEQGEPVSDAFYAMYEKAKAESGIVKTSAQRSKTSQEAIRVLNFLKKNVKTESDIEYLQAVRNVISWDSIPQFYTKKISNLRPDDKDVFEQLKEMLAEKENKSRELKENLDNSDQKLAEAKAGYAEIIESENKI